MEYEYDGLGGKYFVIKSLMHGKVLDVEGGSMDPGAKLCVWDQKEGGDNDNQLFYLERFTSTIRSKMNDFCVDIDGNDLVLNPYNPDNPDQLFEIQDNRIASLTHPGKVFDINESDDWNGVNVLLYDYNSGDNQHWAVEHEPPVYFYIVSQACSNMCLDVKDSSPDPGAEVILWSKNYSKTDNQLWFEDENAILRSKINGFAIDTSVGVAALTPYDPYTPDQQWSFDGPCIKNRETHQVLDIQGGGDSEGTNICNFEYHGGQNQLWTPEF